MRQGERSVHGRQGGVSLMGLIIGLIILAVIALFGMKLIPSFMEFRAAKSAIQAVARDNPGGSPGVIRQAYSARMIIDGIEAVKPDDLDVSGKGNDLTIGFAYRKEVPLFGNMTMCIDYAARAGGQ